MIINHAYNVYDKVRMQKYRLLTMKFFRSKTDFVGKTKLFEIGHLFGRPIISLFEGPR